MVFSWGVKFLIEGREIKLFFFAVFVETHQSCFCFLFCLSSSLALAELLLPKLLQIGHISYAIKKLWPFSLLFSTVSVNYYFGQEKLEKTLNFSPTTATAVVVAAPNQINHSPFFSSSSPFLIQIPFKDNEKSSQNFPPFV